jgi:predicted XRE-type DNA-binding protein
MSETEYSVTSNNVFKDLGFANPEERLAKSKLTDKINSILGKRKLTQTEAAEILGIPQPKVSLLNRGIVSGFSLGKLMTLLNKLNQDVDIVIREKANTRKNAHTLGHIQVVYAG